MASGAAGETAWRSCRRCGKPVRIGVRMSPSSHVSPSSAGSVRRHVSPHCTLLPSFLPPPHPLQGACRDPHRRAPGSRHVPPPQIGVHGSAARHPGIGPLSPSANARHPRIAGRVPALKRDPGSVYRSQRPALCKTLSLSGVNLWLTNKDILAMACFPMGQM
jgi:hypothetical protein